MSPGLCLFGLAAAFALAAWRYRTSSSWLGVAAPCVMLAWVVAPRTAQAADVEAASVPEAGLPQAGLPRAGVPQAEAEPTPLELLLLASVCASDAALGPAVFLDAPLSPAPAEEGGCAEPAPTGLEDPLAPVPECDPRGATGVAAAYVRNVADDRLEAVPGCPEGDAAVVAWLGGHEPDPSARQVPAVEPGLPAELPALPQVEPPALLPPSPYREVRADGVRQPVVRPPTAG